MRKIGILTLPFGPNYGMNLQVYALQTVLEKMGYEVIVINRKWNRVKKNSTIYATIQRFLYYTVFVRNIYSFYKTRIHISKPCYSSGDIINICKKNEIDTVVLGSDQIWRIEHTRGANLDFFGGFVDSSSNIRLLSYAASFGNNNWKGTEQESEHITRLLSSFVAVSVREESGVDLCRNLFGIQAACTIDPTLLLADNDYEIIMGKKNYEKGQLVTYILDEKQSVRDFIYNFRNKNNITNIVNLYPKTNSRYRIYSYDVIEWLNHIKCAEFVITDSFHGMVFSIIFKKQFYVIANINRGIERFTSLLTKLNIVDRLLYEETLPEYIDLKDIDYSKVTSCLDELKFSSIKYLESNVN